ncbi:MAG: ammonium transporter [Protaetiibacter sp.]
MDTGNLAWFLTASALVLFMTPGVAFFYGGLVKAKSVVSMMMMSFGVMGLVTVLWILYGYSMGTIVNDDTTLIPGVLGNPFTDFAHTAMGSAAEGTGPGGDDGGLVGSFFGATFAIITVALISGAIADRAKFGAWMVFAGVWATLVYFPVQGWVWGSGGWIYNLGTLLFGDDAVATGALDWAGGTAVHINAGAAALALALVLGKRIGFKKGLSAPHNVPFVILGASILWFGWFGFNAGAAALSDGLAGIGILAFNTWGATAAAILGWLIVEKIKDGKATSVGAASGAVAGLVAITPACAYLTPGWALVLGLLAGAICALAIELKFKLGFDDSLDVVGVHMVGGFVGCWFLGFFANGTGLINSGNGEQLLVQIIASVTVAAFSFVFAFIIGFVIEKTMGFRVKSEDELAGVDAVVHGEEGYVLTD